MADSEEHALLLQMSYDLARLKKQSDSAEGIVDKGLSNMEKRAKKAAQNLEEAFSLKGANLEGALGQVLQSSRLKILDEGTAKIGLFGGALESLGPIGLGAAAGIGALGVAIEHSLKVEEWALELTHAAHALNVTTDTLQDLDLVAASAGVPVDKLREGIAGLNQAIGKVESGAAKANQFKAWTEALKISPEQLRSWGTLDQQLPHVLEALAKLNPQERAGLSQRFGVDPETLDQLVELRDKIDGVSTSQAHQSIMSQDQVAKAAALATQMKFTGQVIDNNLRLAFVNLGPAIVAVQGLFERFTSGLDRVAAGIARFAYNAQLALAFVGGEIATVGGLTGDPMAGARDVYNRAHAPLPKPPGDTTPTPTGLISPTAKKPKKAASGAGAERRSDDDLDAADKLLAEAQAALATSFEARAAFEVKALQAEETKTQQKLTADLKTAKTQAERDQITKAQGETGQGFDLKRQLVANKLAQQIADQANALGDLELQGREEMLRAQEALGVTTARRGEIALTLFDYDEEIAEAKFAEVIASKTATDAEKERAKAALDNLTATSPLRRQKVTNDNAIAQSAMSADTREATLQAQIAQLDAEKAVAATTEQRRAMALKLFALDEQLQESKLKEQIAEALIAGETERAANLQTQLGSLQATAGLRGQAVSNANPANAWQEWADSAKRATADVEQSLAQMQVEGVEKLNSSLFDAEGRFNNLGQVARNVARSMITSFEQFGLKSFEGGMFGQGSQRTPGQPANPFQSAGSMIGRMFGLGGKGVGGVTQPAGTASDPLYVAMAGPGGLGGGMAGLFGGGQGGVMQTLFGKPGASGSNGFLGGLFGGSSNTGLLNSIGSAFGAGNGKSGAQGGSAGGGLGGMLSGLLGKGVSSAGGGLSSLLAMIPGFAGGGSMTVGGAGGIDKNLALMKVSRGERISVDTPDQQRDKAAGGIGNVTQHFHFPGSSPDGFRRSQRQWSRSSRMAMQYGAGA